MSETEEQRDKQKMVLKNKNKFDELERGEEGVELSLGLSLNGRFGVDPNRPDNAPLVRSSSISNFGFNSGGAEVAALGRTSSLPVGTQEEWRRRKKVQTMRRMEAKRKRVERMMSEKMKNGGAVKIAREGDNGRMGARHVAVGPQGSGGSSGVSENEPRGTNQGANIHVENGSASSVEQKQPITKTNKPSSTKSTNDEAKDTMKNMMMDMPCVSTRGVGPSGKRVEGFLYRYRKAEEVRIVCVCHGSFLTPAEFVKHAGGDDVSQPLKHIVVNTSLPL